MAESGEQWKPPTQDWSIVHPSMRGGPMGYGDPESTFLRKIEREVSIPTLARKVAHKEKCTVEVKAFEQCAKTQGISMVYKCRDVARDMKTCVAKWIQDKDFMDDITERYMKERSDFRRTGVGKPMQRKESSV